MRLNIINLDRFTGEAEEPPVAFYCEYCGNAIHESEQYYEHDGLAICNDCSQRYAWSVFLDESTVKTAERSE